MEKIICLRILTSMMHLLKTLTHLATMTKTISMSSKNSKETTILLMMMSPMLPLLVVKKKL